MKPEQARDLVGERVLMTRCSGSWICDGFKAGGTVTLHPRPSWYRRAWHWLLRVTRIRRHAGQYVVVDVTRTVLTVETGRPW